MDTLWQDIRSALRLLSRHPAFGAAAILTLTLAIGATTAVFSLVEAVLLRPLPFERSGALVRLTADLTARESPDVGLSVAELFDWRDRAGVFESVSGLYPINANLTGGDRPERIEGLLVDTNYFAMLGVQAQRGRVFTARDYRAGIAEVAVISDGLWHRLFGADPAIVGKTMRLDNDLYVILGVAPAGFRHPGRGIVREPDVWCPSGWVASPFRPDAPRFARNLQGALARIRPGLTVAQAQARLATMGVTLTKEFPDAYPSTTGWTPRVIPLQEDLVGSSRQVLWLLMGSVALVMSIACANVASLLLARASAREREMTIRQALGAGRTRLMRQLVTENAIVVLISSALGLLLALWLSDVLVSLSPASAPRLAEVGLSRGVALFVLALSAASTLLVGLAPALLTTRTTPTEVLRTVNAGGSTSPARSHARRVLVVGEVALALLLLMGAGLLVRSLLRLVELDLGYRPAQVLTARVWLPQPNLPETGPYFRQPARLRLLRDVLDRLAARPAVERAGLVWPLPLSGERPDGAFLIEGPDLDRAEVNASQVFLASPGYFETMGIELLRGRLFEPHDDDQRPFVTIVSETLARKFFPGQDAIGKRIRPGGRRSTAPWFQIVGIVRDVATVGVESAPRAQYYRSMFQTSSLSFAVVAKARGEASTLADVVRRDIQAVDSTLPIFEVRTMDDLVGQSLATRRYALGLIGLFSAIALALAAFGVYALLAFDVAQRTYEIGVRLALGAERKAILRLVLWRAATLVGAGIALGLAAALLLTRFLAGLLYGVGATDPTTVAGVVLLLVLSGLVAAIAPARRAMRIDPVIAIRGE
jgi:predicted permease